MKKTPKQKFDLYRSIDKPKLVELVGKKIPTLDRNHVHSIISILLDYLLDKLKKEKRLYITNFMSLKFRTMPARNARNYYTGEFMIAKPYKRIFYSLNKKLAKEIMKNADTEAYFKEKNKQ